MRILILGGAGMLGHKLWQMLSPEFDVYVSMRQPFSRYRAFGIFEECRTLTGIDVRDHDALVEVLGRVRPRVVINSIGIIKQLQEASDPIQSLLLNALLPHRLAVLCRAAGARLIHISTDCVFSGDKGNYREDDHSDARDLYGRTKFLGEVAGPNALTLRTSIIGRELDSRHGLIEWFLSQAGKTVRGYKNAIYTGLTTVELARIIGQIIRQFPNLSGLYQVASTPITKFDLLQLTRHAYRCNIRVEEDTSFRCDRSMDGSRFRHETGITVPSWPQMIEAMRDDPTPYGAWRAAA